MTAGREIMQEDGELAFIWLPGALQVSGIVFRGTKPLASNATTASAICAGDSLPAGL